MRMRMTIGGVPLFLFTCGLAVLSSSLVRADERSWYATTSASCSDPLSLVGVLTTVGWLNKPLGVTPGEGPVADGNYYVSLSAGNFAQISQAEGHSIQYEILELSQQKAEVLRGILKSKAEAATVPLTLQLFLGIVQAYTMSATAGVLTASLYTYWFDVVGSRAVPTAALAEVIGTGGEIRRMLSSFRIKGGGHYAVSSFIYAVTVGNEGRTYLLASCIYPAKVEFKEFQTEGPMNNKVLRFADGKWRVWDVEGNKFDHGYMLEKWRDKEFIYLDRLNNDGTFDRAYRISMVGGPWQYLSDRKWNSLYANIIGS